MRGCLLLQFLHQKRPFQSHSHNSLFRSMNFDNKHVIFRLDIIDLAFQVLAFGSVAGFFSSCVWRMMAPRFLPSAQARINKVIKGIKEKRATGKEVFGSYRKVWM